VIEFSKESRKIVVSHSKIFQEVKEDKKRDAPEKRQDESFSKAKPNADKETLGDLDIFANLKEKKTAKGKKADGSEEE